MTEDLKSGLPVVRAGIQLRASNRLASPPPNEAIWRRDFEFPSFFLVRQLKRVRYKKKNAQSRATGSARTVRKGEALKKAAQLFHISNLKICESPD